LRRIAFLFAIALVWAMSTMAQAPDDTPDEDDGFLVRFINDLLSGPGRDVQISGIAGILSSQATIDQITVADADGIWLRIEDVAIDWSRAALFLRRVNISNLAIGEIAYIRPPLPGEPPGPTLADAEAQPFALPELPVQVRVDALAVDRVALGEPILGQAAELSVTGSASLVAGEIDTDLAITRLDPPGGEFNLDVAFSNATRLLDLDVRLSEPEGGLVATLLDLEGRPAVDLALQGAGPLDDVDLAFWLDAAGTRLAEGDIALRSTEEGLAFRADFAGELAPLVPPDYRPFFAGRSTVLVDGVNIAAGGLRLDELAISGAALDLDGALELGPDNFLQSLRLDGTIGDPRAPALTLPIPGGATQLHSGVLNVTYGEGSRWTGIVALDRLIAGDIEIEDLTLSMGGLAQNLQDPATRNVTINVEGLATGIWAEDPDVRAALGERIDFFADAAIPPDAPVEIRQLQISGSGLSIFTAGTFADLVYSGRNAVRIADLSPFSGLAGRDLAGGIDVRAVGEIAPASGAFDLALDGTATDLAIDEPRADVLLAGVTELSGRLVRDEGGFRTDAFRIANDQVELTSTGQVSSTATDIRFDARLADLALVVPDVSGAITASGSAIGDATSLAVSLEAAIPEGTAAGRQITGLAFGFDGDVGGGVVAGDLRGTGQLNGSTVGLDGAIRVSEDERRVSDLVFTVGPNRLTGDVAQVGDAPIEGRLALQAPQIAPLAALALVEAEGAANAEITLSAAEVGQGVGIVTDLRDLVVGETRVGTLDLSAEVIDAFGLPLADATLTAADLVLGGIAVDTLAAEAAVTEARRMSFAAETRLAIGTEADLAGEIERLEDGFALTLARLALVQDAIAARLVSPATLTIQGEEILLSPLALDLGDGRIEAEGRVADEIDLALAISELPLALANTVQPALGLTGTVDGTARVTGPRDAPDIAFDIAAAGVGSAQAQAAGLPLLGLTATGTTDGRRLDLDAAVTSGNGVSANVSGAIPLDDGPLALDIDLGALPLTIIDGLAGNQGLQGTVTGTATVAGTLAAPEATFALTGTGLTARVLQENAVPPLGLTAQGGFAGNTLTLASANLTGGGIALSGSGTVPLQGPGLNLSVSGSVPLALANAALAERTAQLAGEAALDLSVTGSLQAPQITGPVTVSGATFVDPQLNFRLENIAVAARLEGTTVALDSFSATGAQGGSLSGSGTIGTTAGLPASLQLSFQDLRLSDGTFYTTSLTGALALEGPLTGGGGLISGRIDLGPTEISVAEGLGGTAAAALADVTHRNPPPSVARTLARARAEEAARPQATGAGGFSVNILISAPNQIFVRGRGLDVELGGELQVLGQTNDLQPVGEFTLRRGRLNILGQRIDFDEGNLQLIGNLDPQIFFVAQTVSGDVTAIVTVSGRASSPEITFSSIPERPEDEVLALVLFNRTTDQLSAFQIAQLAAAAAELAGAGGNGLLAQLRGATGLDDLDIVTDEDGTTAVRAGRYISENVYLDVLTSAGGETRASVNLDITDRVTARGSVDTEGNSTIGIYYQRDY
jgi:translocation and assembly module TamB